MLSEREKTHGKFYNTARISQCLKDVMRGSPNWKSLTDMQTEGLEMIAGKVARILCGDPNFDDHWDDIIGYALISKNTDNGQASNHGEAGEG